MTQQELDKIWEDFGAVALSATLYEETALFQAEDEKWRVPFQKWTIALEKWQEKVNELGGQFYSIRNIGENEFEDLIESLEPLGINVFIDSAHNEDQDEWHIIFFKKEE
jgi:hypothetical protein